MEAVSLSPTCLLSDSQPIEPPKISRRLEMPLLRRPIVAPAAQPGEKRSVETVGVGDSSPFGWHVDCVGAKSERARREDSNVDSTRRDAFGPKNSRYKVKLSAIAIRFEIADEAIRRKGPNKETRVF